MLWCCGCHNEHINWLEHGEENELFTCHYYWIIFTDGACSHNGGALARAGFGFAIGDDDDGQMSVPVTNELNDFPRHTSQRAELLTAIEGLQYLEFGGPILSKGKRIQSGRIKAVGQALQRT
jgi:ribonuclease HI